MVFCLPKQGSATFMFKSQEYKFYLYDDKRKNFFWVVFTPSFRNFSRMKKQLYCVYYEH